jgi:hypothetical protein
MKEKKCLTDTTKSSFDIEKKKERKITKIVILLFLILFSLKIIGVEGIRDWSWWWIFFPLLIPILTYVILYMFILLVYIIFCLIEQM